MKSYPTLFLLSLLFFGQALSAQSGANIFKFGGNLLGLIVEGEQGTIGGASVSLDHALRKRNSFLVNLDYNWKHSTEVNGSFRQDSRISIFTFEPEFRSYSKAGAQGLYIGFAPAIHVLKAKLSGFTQLEGTGTRFGVGLKTGYQFTLAPSVMMQVGGGFGMLFPQDGELLILRYGINLMFGRRF